MHIMENFNFDLKILEAYESDFLQYDYKIESISSTHTQFFLLMITVLPLFFPKLNIGLVSTTHVYVFESVIRLIS